MNTLLVWLVLRRLTGSIYRSALVAALFGLHPLHVESVAWVAERKDVLSTFFALLTFWYYAGYVHAKTTWRYAAALFCFALGLMAKPMLVTLPFLLLLLDFWPLQRIVALSNTSDRQAGLSWARILSEKAPFFALAAFASIATVFAQRSAGAMASLDVIPVVVRAANALIGYGMYLWTTIWPAKLAALYPHEPSPSLVMAVVCGVVLLAITVVSVRAAKTQPYLLVGWLWFVGTIVPVSGVMQVGFQSRADRFTYLAHIGLFVAAVWGLAALANRWQVPRRAVAAVAITVVLICAGVTRAQASYWRDGVTLWERAVAVTKPNSRAYSNLGASLAGAGRHAEAVTAYRQALRIDPIMPQAYNNLGLALKALGKSGEALPLYREAVRLKPDYADAHNNLANALLDQRQVDDAIAHFRVALQLQPDNPRTHNNLGAAYAEQGRMSEATAEFLEAVRLEPTRADWHLAAGMAYAVQGDRPKALAYLQTALKLDPTNTAIRQAISDVNK
jgi:Flp pilus assembly protein TadD